MAAFMVASRLTPSKEQLRVAFGTVDRSKAISDQHCLVWVRQIVGHDRTSADPGHKQREAIVIIDVDSENLAIQRYLHLHRR